MKLIVQIPAFNEEKTISDVIKSVPKKIKGIKKVEILVYDDGSTDLTAKNAKKAGANYIFSNNKNLGLSQTFSKALKKSISLDADIIVNTDADNQYDQKEIPKLIKPILDKKADFVTGIRHIKNLKHVSFLKKHGNMIGNIVLSILLKKNIKDASCGFRAYSKECAKNLNIVSEHTYTHETLIQAAFKKMVIEQVSVKFKKRLYGNSRLIQNVFTHIQRAIVTIIRAILMYKAFEILVTAGFIIILLGILGIFRFIYFFSIGKGNGHIQSLIITSILIGIGFNTVVMGILADLITINRKTIKDRLN